jgi:DNA repair exonuclease SbcCD nuclease subunit
MKIVGFNDPHFSARPPASRKSTYTQDILNKLREIVAFAIDVDADLLVCTGDWFISKKPESTPYWLVSEIYEILYPFNGDKATAIGNHDVEAGISNFESSPLHLLCRASEIDFSKDSGFVAADYRSECEILTVNYDKGTVEGIWEVSKQFTPAAKCQVMIVHAPIIPPGYESQYPAAFVEKAVHAADLYGVCDYLFYGDIHDVHGVYHLEYVNGERTTFCNFGSVARVSAHELNRERTVQAFYFDTNTKLIQALELENVKPIEEVFRVEELRREKQVESEVNQFVDALDPTSLSFSILTPDILRQRVSRDISLTDREKSLAVKAIEAAL